MPIEKTHATVLFADRQSAETALMQLRDSGFDMSKVSAVNKNTDMDNVVSANTDSD
ncbi:MAG: hypothetical protein AAF716_18385 [Cyanobacteria bacterium P01_D01_bin.1]